MNSFQEELAKLFAVDLANVVQTENAAQWECTISYVPSSSIDYSTVIGVFSQINSRDLYYIRLLFSEESIDVFDPAKNIIQEFISKNTLYLNGPDLITLCFIIDKKNNESCISIYHLDSFIKYLSSLSPINFFSFFSNLIKDKPIYFELQNEAETTYKSQAIFFVNKDNHKPHYSEDHFEQRKKIYSKSTGITFSNVIANYKLIPDDFDLEFNSGGSVIQKLFLNSRTLLSIAFLFNNTDINNSNFRYTLNGYKTFSNTISLSKIENIKSSTIYFDIYVWTYNGGNLIDKIGLSRNLISLNLTNELELEPNVFDSIKSGFIIYQKENIKQYIEIRNKISDQLWEFQKKAEKITDDFVSDMKKNTFAFISFFVSIIAIRIVSKGDIKGAFTFETTTLTIIILVVSSFILSGSFWEVNEQIKRYQRFYFDLKNRYSDLLTRADINRILNNDKEFWNNLHFVKTKRCIYAWIWGSIIVLFLVLAIFLNNYCNC
jgi:hypothetical protein